MILGIRVVGFQEFQKTRDDAIGHCPMELPYFLLLFGKGLFEAALVVGKARYVLEPDLHLMLNFWALVRIGRRDIIGIVMDFILPQDYGMGLDDTPDQIIREHVQIVPAEGGNGIFIKHILVQLPFVLHHQLFCLRVLNQPAQLTCYR